MPNITSAPTQHTPSATESTTYAPTIFTVQHDPGTASAARLADARPNIIFILTDDQPYHTVAYMPTVRDVLMTGGVVFENGFVTTPLCCPSRVSIWTGQYAHNHGVLTNRLPLGGAQKFDETLSSALWLQAVGYHTAYFGKYLNEYESLTPLGRVPAGWDTWGALLDRVQSAEDTGSENSYESYSFSENGQIMEGGVFSADWVTQRSVDFISASRDAPFFLVMAYYNPHTPYFWADRHDGQFRANSFLRADPYRPPNFLEADVSDKPEYFQQLIDGLSVEKIDTRYNHLLRSLLSVDDGVASVLAELDQMNLRDNTIVVFISDNGLTVGNHVPGMMKNCVYEECIRVPFIVYAPAFFAARTDLRLVANIDLAPTFADLSGAPIPDSVDGLSLLPLLYDPSIPWRDGLLLEHWPTDGETHLIPEFHAIRTSEWKYVEYVTGEVELYDLINDPYELSNLAALPECVRCGGVEG
ncbi:MAG: sulfatase [Anaerolineales bacterium]|nr:sulfatase [Anaerolineales bacterium]